MTDISKAGMYRLGDRNVQRIGYGAMQLAGPGVFGPPKDRDAALAVLRAAVANLGRETIDVVNLRLMFGSDHGPAEGSLEAPLTALAALRDQGLVRQIGLSNATSKQVAEARAITGIACVQNLYNLAHRDDDALIDALAADGIAYVPFFPLGGFSPLQSDALDAVAARLGATPMQVALAWLLQRSPNILLIAGTSSVAHLHENLAAADLVLPEDALAELDAI